MTVYLWVRHLDGSILVRSPEVISLRNAAAREGPRNPQCGDLRPDDDGFVDSIRRSSRKSVPTVSPSTQAETSSGTARGKFQRETPERGETREQFRKKQDAAKNGVKNDKTPKVGKVRKRKRTPKQVAQAVLKEERTKKTKLPKSAAKLEERGRSGLTREEERTQKRIHKAVELLEQVRGTKPDRGERGQATLSAPIAGQEIAGKEIAGRRLGTLASQKIPLKTTEGKERSLKKLKRDPSQANTLVPPERFHRDERQQEHHRSSREPSPEIQHQPSPEIRSQSPHRPEFKRKANTNTWVPLVSVQENHRPSHELSPEIHSQSPRRPSMYPREPSHQPSPEICSQSPSRYPREPSHQPSPKIRSQSPRSPIKYPRELSHQPSPEIHSHYPRRPDALVLPSWQLQQQANLVEAMRVQVSQRDDLIAALQCEKAAKEAELKPREPREPVKHEAITDTHVNVVAMKQLELIAQMQRETHDAALAKKIKKSVKEKTAKKYSLQKDIEAGYAFKAKQQAAQDLRLILAATSVSQHSGNNPPSKRSRSRSMRSRSPPKHVGSKSSSSSSSSSVK